MSLATAPPSLRPSQIVNLHPTLSRFRWHLRIPALYLLLTILLLWPLVGHLRSAVPDTISDPLLNTWTLRWVQHALVTNPTHLYDGNMFAPNARSLAFSELLLPQAIMAWPVWLVTHNALLTYNLSVLITYPLCAVAMYALCRALGAVRGAAFVAGVLFAFAPFRLDNNAHLQVLSMQWMPLALLAVIRYMQRPTRWRFTAVAAMMTLAVLSSVYYTMMFGTALAVFLAVEMIRQRRLFWSRAALGLLGALAIAGVIVVALDVPYLTMRHEHHIVRTLDESYDNSARPDSFVTVTPGSLLWRHILPHSGAERSALFPGALLLLLALVGLASVRCPWMAGLVALGIVSFVLSFGPTWGAKDQGAPLPYRLLYEHVAGYKGIRGPDRFEALVLLALCPIAALGATRLWRSVTWWKPALLRYAPLIAVLIGALAVGECATRLLPTVPVDQSAATLAPYRWLAAHPGTGTVAEFPVANTELQTSFYSTYHWRRVLWGHSGFIPAATYQLRGKFVDREDYPGTDDFDVLADMGVDTLVIHRSAYPPDQIKAFTQTLRESVSRVKFLATVGDCDLYQLLPNAAVPPLTATASFKVNPAGNLDKLPGQVTITNAGAAARMLYTHGSFDLAADIRDEHGTRVSHQPATIIIPAVIPAGVTTVPLSVELPREPGTYSIDLQSSAVSLLDMQPPTTVKVVGLTVLPHLTLSGNSVTSPPMYEAGETVAMWVTTKDGATIALRNTIALPDGTLGVMIDPLPPGAAQVVAHGKSSGVELWVAPP